MHRVLYFKIKVTIDRVIYDCERSAHVKSAHVNDQRTLRFVNPFGETSLVIIRDADRSREVNVFLKPKDI